MCGIAGIVQNSSDATALKMEAESLAGELSHRGPDSSGVWCDESSGIALSHRRLAIQDLSAAGHQPMESSSGRYVIVLNGEIYNFRSLARELAQAGYSFRGHSDTEILLGMIEHVGIERALQRCEGMFAFALWDRSTRSLTLCRDRLGEKPLYYGWLDGGFVFASELKPIIRRYRQALEIDRSALAEYMRHGYIGAPYSIFKRIFKLPPGCLLTLAAASQEPVGFSPRAGGGGIAPRRFWSVREVAGREPVTPGDPAALTDQLDTLLRTIIREQSIADVPLGTFLSGGIDSTLVTAVLQAESSSPVKSFTIGFDEAQYNEAEFAKAIAGHLKTEHTELYVRGQDCLDLVPELPRLFDEPFADASQIPSYLVSKLARQQVTVCLSGDGGDELFGGYNRYVHTESLMRRAHSVPAPLRRLLAGGAKAVGSRRIDCVYELLQRWFPGRIGKQSNVGLKVTKAAELLEIDSVNDIYRFLMSYWREPEALVIDGRECGSLYHDPELLLDRDFHAQAMLWDQYGYLPGDNLAKVDRASMAVSLETRLPLLDRRLVEFAWTVPSDLKIKGGTSKWLLRQCLLRYVPADLVERPKMGFSVPIGSWLRGPLRDWAESLLNQKQLEATGHLRPSVIAGRWNDHLSGKADNANAMWAVLMYQAWMQYYRLA